MTGLGVLILAGGEATRLPRKLELAAGDAPLVVRVLRNVSTPGTETLVAGKGTFPQSIDDALRAPIVVDRWPGRGPLGGMLTAMSRMHAPWIFAVAGDLPFADAAFAARLLAQREAGDEAVVPIDNSGGETRMEPLAAIYDRLAFLRDGFAVLRARRGAVHAVVHRLRARLVSLSEPDAFRNVNTEIEYAAARKRLEREGAAQA